MSALNRSLWYGALARCAYNASNPVAFFKYRNLATLAHLEWSAQNPTFPR